MRRYGIKVMIAFETEVKADSEADMEMKVVKKVMEMINDSFSGEDYDRIYLLPPKVEIVSRGKE